MLMVLWVAQVKAQSYDRLRFGTDSTLEVVTWNIERFPKNGQLTISEVRAIIGSLDIDVWALQEISDTASLNQAISTLPDYKAEYGTGFNRGLAFVYNTKTIKKKDVNYLFSESSYRFPLPRAPLVLEFIFKDSLVKVVNNHYKCCGNGRWERADAGDEESRRYNGHRLVMDYVDSLWSKENVMVLGDLNDILTDDRDNNIFQNELSNARDYLFVDLLIEQSSSTYWSYPSWPSHLDHILINRGLIKHRETGPNTMVRCIKLESVLTRGWNEYDRNISDHRPVAYRFKFKNESLSSVNAKDELEQDVVFYPNPVSNVLTIDSPIDKKLEHIRIFNTLGELILDEELVGNQLDLSDFELGVYYLVYTAMGVERKVKLVKN